MWLKKFDKIFIKEMHIWAPPLLRYALGIVFLWFGALKIIGQSPVAELVRSTYSIFPEPMFLFILGVWEAVIGLGLIFRIWLRAILLLLWLQLGGTLIALILLPPMFFHGGNPLLLTVEGEFVVKNLVLIAASIVIGGYEIKSKN